MLCHELASTLLVLVISSLLFDSKAFHYPFLKIDHNESDHRYQSHRVQTQSFDAWFDVVFTLLNLMHRIAISYEVCLLYGGSVNQAFVTSVVVVSNPTTSSERQYFTAWVNHMTRKVLGLPAPLLHARSMSVVEGARSTATKAHYIGEGITANCP